MPIKPLLVGVTGGIGSGKSTVCKILEVLGHKVYYADDRAKWLMSNDSVLMSAVNGLFGPDAYVQGKLNRSHIADLVFKDAGLLEKLNALVHPAVGEDLRKWVSDNREDAILFDEAALLFEIGTYKKMDATILVVAPEALRIQRVLKRDSHRSENGIKEIIDKQMKDEEKRLLADYMIVNDEEHSIIKQTLDVYEELLSRHR